MCSLKIIYNVIANSCGNPISFLENKNIQFGGGTNSLSPFTEGTVVEVKCKNGYFWSDMVFLKELFCNDSIWTTVPNCLRIT